MLLLCFISKFICIFCQWLNECLSQLLPSSFFQTGYFILKSLLFTTWRLLSPAFIWSSRYARYLWHADEQEISSFLLDTSTFKTSPSAQTESHTIQCAVTVSPSMFSTSTCQLMENPHSTDACPCDSFKQDLFHNTPQFQVGVTGSCHVAV